MSIQGFGRIKGFGNHIMENSPIFVKLVKNVQIRHIVQIGHMGGRGHSTNIQICQYPKSPGDIGDIS